MKIKLNLKPFILLYVIGVVFFACKREINNHPYNPPVYLSLWIRDSAGQNMLDSTTLNYYKAPEIRVYNLVRGVKTEAYNPMMDAPRNFIIAKISGNNEYLMKIYPYKGDGTVNSASQNEEIATTYINWRGNDEDTIICTYAKTNSIRRCTKITYNQVVQYNGQPADSIHFGDAILSGLIQVIK